MALADEIRRAIRRLRADTLRGSARQWGREDAIRCLRLSDDVLLAIHTACEADRGAGARAVHVACMAQGVVCTYRHVVTLRAAMGFKGLRANVTSRTSERREQQASDMLAGVLEHRMPGHLAALLDELPERERRKVIAEWAR